MYVVVRLQPKKVRVCEGFPPSPAGGRAITGRISEYQRLSAAPLTRRKDVFTPSFLHL